MAVEAKWSFAAAIPSFFSSLRRSDADCATSQHKWTLIFEQAQSFEPQGFGKKRLVDMAVRGAQIISAGEPIGQQRTAACAPVAPFAGAASLFCVYRDPLDALPVVLYCLQRIGMPDGSDALPERGLALGDPAMLIDDQRIYADSAGMLVVPRQVSFIDQ